MHTTAYSHGCFRGKATPLQISYSLLQASFFLWISPVSHPLGSPLHILSQWVQPFLSSGTGKHQTSIDKWVSCEGIRSLLCLVRSFAFPRHSTGFQLRSSPPPWGSAACPRPVPVSVTCLPKTSLTGKTSLHPHKIKAHFSLKSEYLLSGLLWWLRW